WTCRVVIERLYADGVEPPWTRVVDLPKPVVPPAFRAKGSRFRLSGLYRTAPAGTLANACRIEIVTVAFRPAGEARSEGRAGGSAGSQVRSSSPRLSACSGRCGSASRTA